MKFMFVTSGFISCEHFSGGNFFDVEEISDPTIFVEECFSISLPLNSAPLWAILSVLGCVLIVVIIGAALALRWHFKEKAIAKRSVLLSKLKYLWLTDLF